MFWTFAVRDSRLARLGLAMRAVKALAGGSVFYLLALPLVSLSSCGGGTISYTGYEALRGVTVPVQQFSLSPDLYPNLGPIGGSPGSSCSRW
jgi:hypothetical protein